MLNPTTKVRKFYTLLCSRGLTLAKTSYKAITESECKAKEESQPGVTIVTTIGGEYPLQTKTRLS